MQVSIPTPTGTIPGYLTRPQGEGLWPGVLLYSDAFGVRATTRRIADRMADEGYVVLLPDLFHRVEVAPPFDPRVVFRSEAEMKRLLALIARVDEPTVMGETVAYLDFLARDPRVRGDRVGCFGYCMGGGLALRAACTFPGRIAAAASIHGGRFITDPTAPAAIAASLEAPVYLAVSEIDRRHTPRTTAHLEAALTEAGVPHLIETFPGVTHGFAVDDLPVYDRGAAERTWTRTVTLFRATLRPVPEK